MMNSDSGYSYEYDSRYCYPLSNVLINKLGIVDGDKLHIAEREITAIKLANAKVVPIKGNFDLQHLKDIHRYIFEDVYEWAGEIRWVNIAKGNMFCNYEYVEAQADILFEKLKKESYLINKTSKQISIQLAYYLSEINVLHPFREGNGRVQRLFIEYLSDGAGYSVDFSNVTSKEMIEASAEAFVCEYRLMNKLFKKIVSSKEQKME